MAPLTALADRRHGDLIGLTTSHAHAPEKSPSTGLPSSPENRQLSALADSTAFRDPERILAQHQAALTLLQARLSAPNSPPLAWLDLACGRGQIILGLEENLSSDARAKIAYWAYDLDQTFARETRRAAERVGFASFETRVGDLSDFHRVLPEAHHFDFVTVTNTIHEVHPARLSEILVNCIERLSDTGTLFIYDMERLVPLELGALPWKRDDIRLILRSLLDALGATEYAPEVGRWSHRNCNGWNVQIQRQHLNVARAVAIERRDRAITAVTSQISDILKRRMDECRASLETLTIYGAQTAEEEGDKERLLFDFWAAYRALEAGI